MLPGFSATSSLYRTRHVYRANASPPAFNSPQRMEIFARSAEPADFAPFVSPALKPCVGPNCPGPNTPGSSTSIWGCGPSCIQGWSELLDDCLYNCTQSYSGVGDYIPLQECILSCQSTVGPANWKCDCPGGTCVNGNCVCPTGTTACATGCCAPPQQCPAGQILCSGVCVSSSTSTNCGTCNNACKGGQTCQNGVCSCPSGQTLCNGACVDTSTSTSNCGKCGNACAVDDQCVNGQCSKPSLGVTCDRLSADCVEKCMAGGNCTDTNHNCSCCCSDFQGCVIEQGTCT